MLNQSNRKNLRSKVKPLSLCVTAAMSFSFTFIISVSPAVNAEQFFNPAFLSDDTTDAIATDLTRFESGKQPAGNYIVDIYVNSHFVRSKGLNFIEKEGLKDKSGLMPCFNLGDLKNMGINTGLYPELEKDGAQGCLDFLTIIPDTSTDLQLNRQKLTISVPQAYLNTQVQGYIPPEQWENGITALYSNYYLSGNHSSQNDSQSLYFSLNNGLNIGAWQFRHNGVLSYNKTENNSDTTWKNVNTYVQRNIIPIKSKLTIGDSYTPGNVFDGINFRGIQLATSEGMFTDREQGFAPVIRGTAKTNAKVTIKQNGYLAYQENVSAGPFVISDMSSAGLSGDYEVTIEESDGSVNRYIVPYSTLAIFKRPGRFEYSLTAGEYRSGSNSKGNPNFLQATAISGLNNYITLYGGTQIADSYSSGLVGVGGNLGNYGAVSFDLTHANSKLIDDSKHSGQSVRFLYSKSMLKTGTTFQLLGYRYSTKGYFTFNDVANSRINNYENYLKHENDPSYIWQMSDELRNPRKGRFEANISHNFVDYGSIYLTGSQQTYWNRNGRDEWLTLGYSNNWRGLTYNLNVAHNSIASDNSVGDTIYGLSLSLPLSNLYSNSMRNNPINDAYTSLDISHSKDAETTYRTSLTGTLLKDKNLRYNISQSHTNESRSDYTSTYLNYSGTYAEYGAGFSQSGNNNQFTFNASGSALFHQNGLTLGRSINGTSVLVKAPGASGLSIENNSGLKTDWRGYAIIPFAQAYRMNRIALNTNNLPDNIEMSKNVDFIAPTEGAISRVTFETKPGIRALITLKHKGQGIPFASQVTELNTQSQSMVADGSRVFLAGLPLQGRLKIQWGNNPEDQCSTNYVISEKQITSSVTQFELNCD